jgi:hypothetical protein
MSNRFVIFLWAIGLLAFAFVLGLVAGGGVYGITAINPTTGHYAISNKISGITWSCMLASCVKVDFDADPKKQR